MAVKKIPLRRCTGCCESKPKKELVRVVKSPEGSILLDVTGKKPGRGAYVCKSSACLAKARKAKRIERALECAIPDALYEEMRAQLNTEGETCDS